MSDHYTPSPSTPNYMSSDWGSSQTKYTVQHIDHVADKAKFAIQMLETAVKGLDVLEKEIVDLSNATTIPSRESIRALAYRIDAQQGQVQSGLDHLKNMMSEIDRATDNIQKPRTSW